LDGIDVDCHCGRGGSSNVEKTVLKILEACVTGQISIVVLEKDTVKLPGSVLSQAFILIVLLFAPYPQPLSGPQTRSKKKHLQSAQLLSVKHCENP